MPLISLDKKTKERVDITEYYAPKIELKGRELECQECGGQMMIKHGLIVVPHFAHYPDPARTCFYESESMEHLMAKKALVLRLSGKGQRYQAIYTGAKFDYEVTLKENGIVRRADILVTYPDGSREIHEIQLSPIATQDLQQRTADYLSMGATVFWWLGPKAATVPNKSWCMEEHGYFAYVEPDEVQVF